MDKAIKAIREKSKEILGKIHTLDLKKFDLQLKGKENSVRYKNLLKRIKLHNDTYQELLSVLIFLDRPEYDPARHESSIKCHKPLLTTA